jgi:hypothetical protein
LLEPPPTIGEVVGVFITFSGGGHRHTLQDPTSGVHQVLLTGVNYTGVHGTLLFTNVGVLG